MTTITAMQALEALDELESSARGDEPFNHLAAPVVREFIENALAAPATAPAQPAPKRKPMTDEEVIDLVRECGLDWHKGFMPLFDDDPTNRFAVLVRAVEARFLQGTSWDSREQDVHPDDKAVDRFAGRMKWKLANARAKGKSGWQDRSWTPDQISAALRQHVDKGDPTDVANYCMFLAARGEPITSATAPSWQDAPTKPP